MQKKSGRERRKYKRVIFTPEDGIVGVFQPPDGGSEPLTADVINLSEGGVQLTFKSILENRIREGDRLILTEIRGKSSSQVIINVDTEVRWISQDELSHKTGIGCEFQDLFVDSKKKITDFVEFWYLQRVSN
jgi:c-di-GMP-binding flagellar brake protein YcgR